MMITTMFVCWKTKKKFKFHFSEIRTICFLCFIYFQIPTVSFPDLFPDFPRFYSNFEERSKQCLHCTNTNTLFSCFSMVFLVTRVTRPVRYSTADNTAIKFQKCMQMQCRWTTKTPLTSELFLKLAKVKLNWKGHLQVASSVRPFDSSSSTVAAGQDK